VFSFIYSNLFEYVRIWHSYAFSSVWVQCIHTAAPTPISTVPHTVIRNQKSVISDRYIQFLTSLYLWFKRCGSRIKSGYPIRSFIASSFWTASSLVSASIHSVLVSNSRKLCIISSVIWMVWKEYQHIVLFLLVWSNFKNCRIKALLVHANLRSFYYEKNKWYPVTTNIRLIWYHTLTSFLLCSSKYFRTNMAPTAIPKWLFTSMIQFFQRGGDASLPNKTW